MWMTDDAQGIRNARDLMVPAIKIIFANDCKQTRCAFIYMRLVAERLYIVSCLSRSGGSGWTTYVVGIAFVDETDQSEWIDPLGKCTAEP